MSVYFISEHPHGGVGVLARDKKGLTSLPHKGRSLPFTFHLSPLNPHLSSPNPHPLLYHCRLRDIVGDDAHVPHVDARNMHKIKDIILNTLLPKLVNYLSAKHYYLPRYSPTMPTGSLAFTYPHPADLSSPVSYSFFPALL